MSTEEQQTNNEETMASSNDAVTFLESPDIDDMESVPESELSEEVVKCSINKTIYFYLGNQNCLSFRCIYTNLTPRGVIIYHFSKI